VTSVGTLSVLLAIPDAYFALPWMARSRLYVHVEPMWLHLASRAAAIWFWSELAVVLLNRRRRALHDFLAGTVVVTEAGEVSVLPVNHYP
jgi:uncharacterized RDD family membrane protein YckC